MEPLESDEDVDAGTLRGVGAKDLRVRTRRPVFRASALLIGIQRKAFWLMANLFHPDRISSDLDRVR